MMSRLHRDDLLAEFLCSPLGPYSPELSELLIYLRSRYRRPRVALVEIKPGSYCIATLPESSRDRLMIDESVVYASVADGETAVFLRRWRQWERDLAC